MEAFPYCEYLEWDSNFFGCRIGRITVNRLNQEILEDVRRWCRSEKVDCLYFLADSDDRATVRLAEHHQFHLVDIRILYERRLNPGEFGESVLGPTIRHCLAGDMETLKAIARMSHGDSRFYYDSNFPAARCHSLYEIWIEKSCQGFADAVLVPVLDGQPAGYSSCHVSGRNEGAIGLFAIGPDFRGKGLSRKLVYGSLEWFSKKDIKTVQIITQGRNFRAQRLYEGCGFLTKSVQLWYHWWFSKKA